MSNLKKIREKISITNQSYKICKSMYNLASIKMSKAKKDLEIMEEKFKKLQSVLYENGLFSKDNENAVFNFEKNRIIFIIKSNVGFCGDFNNHDDIYDGKDFESSMEESQIIEIGKKSINPELITESFENFYNIILENIKGNENFEFRVNSFFDKSTKTISLKPNLSSEKSKKDCVLEMNVNIVKDIYIKTFLEYVFNLGIYFENCNRSSMMKSAMENSKEVIKTLSLNMNKFRQNSITNEILIGISGQRVE